MRTLEETSMTCQGPSQEVEATRGGEAGGHGAGQWVGATFGGSS